MGIGERIKGAMQELGGKAKEALGHANRDERLVQEGRVDQVQGQDRQDAAKVNERIQGAAEQVGGRVKSVAGAVTGDNSTEAEGKLDELKGQVRRKINE
jgi:uncharacterized protein YjbJ (UPF0337 family)